MCIEYWYSCGTQNTHSIDTRVVHKTHTVLILAWYQTIENVHENHVTIMWHCKVHILPTVCNWKSIHITWYWTNLCKPGDILKVHCRQYVINVKDCFFCNMIIYNWMSSKLNITIHSNWHLFKHLSTNKRYSTII
jgi:hypothetical protein